GGGPPDARFLGYFRDRRWAAALCTFDCHSRPWSPCLVGEIFDPQTTARGGSVASTVTEGPFNETLPGRVGGAGPKCARAGGCARYRFPGPSAVQQLKGECGQIGVTATHGVDEADRIVDQHRRPLVVVGAVEEDRTVCSPS